MFKINETSNVAAVEGAPCKKKKKGKRDKEGEKEKMSLEEVRLRKVIRALIEKKYKTNSLGRPTLLEFSGGLPQGLPGGPSEMGEGTTPVAIHTLNSFFSTTIRAKGSDGRQLESVYMSLDKPRYRVSFVKHVVQMLYDFLSSHVPSILPLESLLEKYPRKKEQFSRKLSLTEGKLHEKMQVTVDKDGLPNVDDIKQEKEEVEKEQEEEVQKSQEEESEKKMSLLQGESSIGRAKADVWIDYVDDTLLGAINDITETEEETQAHIEEGDTPPVQQFLEYLFINIILYCWEFENKHYASTFEEADSVYSSITDIAKEEKDEVANTVVKDQEEDLGLEDPEGDLGLEDPEGDLDFEDPEDDLEL